MKKIFLLAIATVGLSFMIQQNGKNLEAGQEGVLKSITLPVVEVKLKEGEGVEKIAAHCTICHSVDYITMQPQFSNGKWSEIVHKMINVFGAPVNEDDAQMIINYLSDHYGTGK